MVLALHNGALGSPLIAQTQVVHPIYTDGGCLAGPTKEWLRRVFLSARLADPMPSLVVCNQTIY